MQGLLPGFIDNQFDRQQRQGRMFATVLFADLQGFTSYTERLMKSGKSGAERLSRLLNDVFGSAAEAIHRRGGFIPYFAGDAFAGLFPEHLAPEEALYAAEEIRQALDRLNVEIPLRIGIDLGQVEWHITSSSPHTWYIRGEGIARAVHIQTMAPANSIFLSHDYHARLQGHGGPACSPVGECYELTSLAAKEIIASSPQQEQHTASFYPIFLTQRFRGAEFRRVTSLFLAFPEDLSIEETDLLLQVATAEIYRREGYYKETDFTDKGGLIVAFFGAPINTGESRRMALQTALALVYHPALANIRIRIGVSTGPAFCGLVGNDWRRQYIVASRSVNLAARLALKARVKEILCDESTIRDLGADTIEHEQVQAKGFQYPITVFSLSDLQEVVQKDEILYGRKEVLDAMVHWLQQPSVQCLEVLGEPGIGKTFITRAAVKETGNVIDWLHLQGDPANTAPFADLDQAWMENTARHTDQRVIDLIEENKRIRADAEMSPRVRFERLQDVHVRLFQIRQQDHPLGLFIEHWQDLDFATRALIREQIVQKKLIVMCTSRRPIEEFASLEGDMHHVCTLEGLGHEGITILANTVLQGPIAAPLIEILDRAGNGNPFYTEQLLLYLRDNQLLTREEGAWTVKESELVLGGTLQDILLARLDRLEQGVREVLKSASVIGTAFELPVLQQIMLAEGTGTEDLPVQLHHAEQAEILRSMDELSYIFRHSLLREVIYDLQLESRLKQLHGLAVDAMEIVYADDIGPHLGVLAEHSEAAGWVDRAAHYLEEAGQYALRQYQNQEALQFFDRALDHASAERHYALHLAKLPAYEALGMWQNAVDSIEAILETAQVHDGRRAELLAALGHFRVLLGAYQQADDHLEEAIRLFELQGDQPGITRCHRDLATLYFRQGDYERAETYITRSMVQVDDPSEIDNQLVMSLALIRMNQGRYIEAEQLLYNDLLIRHQTGEKQCLVSLYTNLGIVQNEMGHYKVALSNLEKGLHLAEEMGHPLWISIALGSRGLVREHLGDWKNAMLDYQQDLVLGRELQDRQGESIALELMGSLELRQGLWASGEAHLEQSLVLSQQIGYRKGQVKAYLSLSRAKLIQGDAGLALSMAGKASALAREMKNRKLQAQSHLIIAWILLEAGEGDQARSILAMAEEDVMQWDDPAMQRDWSLLSARTLDPDRRMAVLLTFRQQGEDREMQAEAAYQVARMTGTPEDRELARSFLSRLLDELPAAIYQYRLNQLT
ncbi:MAG: tetratricopeptide repeat protein [Saprospiraceae bacterium]